MTANAIGTEICEHGPSRTRMDFNGFDHFAQDLIRFIEVNHVDSQHPFDSVKYLRHESFYAQRAIYHEITSFGWPEASRILELGCGWGVLSSGLLRSGFDVTAVDVHDRQFVDSSPYVRYIKNTYNVQLSDSFVSQNLEERVFDFPDNYFDLVVSVDTIEHIKNVKAFMENTKRCVKDGGLIMITTPNYARLIRRVLMIKQALKPAWPIPFWDYVDHDPYTGHIREFTPRELRMLFSAFELEIVRHVFPSGSDMKACSAPSLKKRLKWFVLRSVEKLCQNLWPAFGPTQLLVGRK